MGSIAENSDGNVQPKKQILLNAFDMSTIGHLSPGQWKNPSDQSTKKRKLGYWIELAKLLERGNINALFLADTYGGYDTCSINGIISMAEFGTAPQRAIKPEGHFLLRPLRSGIASDHAKLTMRLDEDSLDNCIRRAAQWPMTDPSIPISAMAAVTKNLTFGITASTSFEPPFLLAKRFSTLDHLTDGRIAWNIVTSWKKAAFKAIGVDNPIEHDTRYYAADEYLRLLYKLWESSWSDDAIVADAENDVYFDPDKIRTIRHHGKYYNLDSRHITDPSPQRIPFLFQAGTSPAGSAFAATHAEAIFVSSHSPKVLRPKIENIRKLAKEQGRDPQSIKFFGTFTPILGRTEEEARAKYEEAQKYASTVGGLVLFSGWTGIDASKIPLDQDITAADSTEAHKVRSMLDAFTTTSPDVPRWTPRVVAEKAAIGGLGPVGIGTPAQVADEMQRWIDEADLDGFNLAYVTTPGTFEDVVDLLIPELRRRGLYAPARKEDDEPLTAREKVYGKGQSKVRDDHAAAKYRYDVYTEEEPYGSSTDPKPADEAASKEASSA